MFAPKITGIDIRKENFIAFFSLRPNKTPEEIVAPAREIPGIKANACAIPIKNEFLYPIFFSFL